MSQLIQGKKSIMSKFNITESQFYMFVKLNMPVRLINRRWYGHSDNIDSFFKEIMIAQAAVEINGDIDVIKDKEK